MAPSLRLLLAFAGGLYAFKVVALVTRQKPRTPAGMLLFLFAWPGVFPDAFRERRRAGAIEPATFLAAWARMAAGIASILLLAIYAPRIPDTVLGLGGIAALLLTLHFGVGDLLPWLLRWAGFGAPLLFDRPWAARSLAEFWGRRWNLAFVEINRRLLLRPLRQRLSARASRLALFALSGLLHEMAISYPAGAGWGLPLAYFLLQGALVAVEERFRIAGRAWTCFWLIAPAPWLFHQPFRRALVIPFYRWLHDWMAQNTGEWYLSHALYAAAIAHLLVLIASFQAPARLGWRHDIGKLTRFNQRIFWVYAGYVLLCIVSFAGLTWRLHDAFLAGELSARWLAGFIAVFWTIRVLVDFFWYDSRDWPPGNALVTGHALVTSLFGVLATVYWCAAFV
jgi:Membrane bound O-acyl transferase family